MKEKMRLSLRGIDLDIPESWEVRSKPELTEIVPPSAAGALHMTFLRRRMPTAPSNHDASLLVENLAQNAELKRAGPIRAAMVNAQQSKAVGRFVPTALSADTPRLWLVGALVWQEGAVQVTYCTDSEDADWREAMRIVDTIRRS